MEWQPIDDLYEVSCDGQVRRCGVNIRQSVTDKGYKRVTVNGRSMSVHRLVATAFIPNPLLKKEVNHKNGVKGDNRSDNLEWCTRSENMAHAYATGLHGGVILKGEKSPNWRRNGHMHPQSIAVVATFKDGTTKKYESQGLAEVDGYCSAKISMCINGKRKSHKGAIWMPLPPPPVHQEEEK